MANMKKFLKINEIPLIFSNKKNKEKKVKISNDSLIHDFIVFMGHF